MVIHDVIWDIIYKYIYDDFYINVKKELRNNTNHVRLPLNGFKDAYMYKYKKCDKCDKWRLVIWDLSLIENPTMCIVWSCFDCYQQHYVELIKYT